MKLSGHDRWSGSIVWLDFTKYGKLSGSDLNDCCDLLAMILGRKPQKSVGLIMAPPFDFGEGAQRSQGGDEELC